MSATTPSIAPPPPCILAGTARELAARIEQLRRRQHRVVLGTGLAMGVTALMLWLTSETITDFLTNLPWLARLGFLLIGVSGALALAWWSGVRLWCRRIDDETIALLIERALPEFQSRFIAAVQLARQPESIASPGLVRALVAETTALAATQDFSCVIDDRPWQRWRTIATCALLAAGALAVIGGPKSASLLRRAVLSTEAVPRKTLIRSVDAPTVIAVGEDWRVIVAAGGMIPAEGRLRVKSASGRRQEFALPVESAEAATFSRMLQSVPESFDFTIALGDAETDSRRVRVQPCPTVAGVECRQIFPAYTQLPTQRRALGDLKILAGSWLALRVQTSTGVNSGEIILLGADRKNPLKTTPLTRDPQAAAILTGEIEIVRPGVTGFTLRLVDADGIESRGVATYPIEVLTDQPTTIKLLWPDRREELLTRDATMLLSFEARDDFGVAGVRLHYAVDWVEGAPFKTIDLDIGSARPKALTRRFHWRIGQIVPHVEIGSVIDYWLEALDANDVSGPGTATLEHWQVRIVSEAEKRADLALRLSDTMEGLSGMRQTQEEVNRRLGEIIFEKPPEAK